MMVMESNQCCVNEGQRETVKELLESMGAITDDFCEDCLVEYEALKCRQAEERRMFWEGYTESE